MAKVPLNVRVDTAIIRQIDLLSTNPKYPFKNRTEVTEECLGIGIEQLKERVEKHNGNKSRRTRPSVD